jgi:hypothetical protein
MVAAVNADGLWRWDFRAQPHDEGAVYEQFWVQLMEWCATFSEFRPGEDYAVRVRESTAEPGQPVRVIVGWRGAASPEPQPSVEILRDGVRSGEASVTPLTAEDGNREWAAVVNPDQPGHYQLHVVDKAHPDRPQGSATFTVSPQPAEADDLRADPQTLATLAEASGGQTFKTGDGDKLAALLSAPDPATSHTKPRWEPLWPTPWVALLIGAVFGGEWWLRRREGLL